MAPIEGAIEHLKKHSVPIHAGPMKRFGAKGEGTSVYFRDPDGSLMEFMVLPRTLNESSTRAKKKKRCAPGQRRTP